MVVEKVASCHFFEVYMAPLCLRHGQGSMKRNPCCARLLRICRTCRQIRLKPPGAVAPEPPRGFLTVSKPPKGAFLMEKIWEWLAVSTIFVNKLC